MTVVAIDFGTSNTVVCTQDPVTQTPRVLKFPELSRTFATAGGQVHVIPSQVFVKGSDSFVIGDRVRAQRLGYAQPQRFFQAFKRDLAANFRPPARVLDDTSYDAETIAEVFLKAIWESLHTQVPECSKLIFTVPVGAFESYLDWFRDFARTLTIPSVQMVDESTAAALGYAVQQPGTVVLVIDFGGGTLDLSLVRTVTPKNANQTIKAEVLAKSDAYIGGVDIDTWIVEYYLRRIGASRAEVGELGWLNLLELAEKLKIRLSEAPEARESWFDDEQLFSHELKLTRDELAEILESNQLLEQLRQSLDEVLAIALGKGIGKPQIEQVLLVGGSCQILAVQQLVVSYFGRQRVKLDKPFDAVARGALILGEAAIVDDYLRHGYSIRLWEPYTRTYSYFPIFEKGTKYPSLRSEPLTLQVAVEGQREIRLDIGEIAEVSQAEVTYDARGRMSSSSLHRHADFRSLADARHVNPLPQNALPQNALPQNTQPQVCIAHLDPPGQTGMDRVEVYFEVNDRRMLIATVRDLLTQKILVEKGAIAKLE